MGMSGGMAGMHAVFAQRRAQELLAEGRPTWATVRRLGHLLAAHRRTLAAALAFTVLGVLLSLIPPLLMRAVIDQAILQHRLQLLFELALALMLVPAFGAVVSVAQSYLNTVVSQALIHDLRTALYDHGQRLGIRFFTQTPAGQIHSRLVNDLNAVQGVMNQTLTGLFVNLLTISLTLAIMFVLDWRLAILATLVLPGFVFPVMAFGRRSYDAMGRTQEALSAVTSHLEETLTLSGTIVVRSFGAQPREGERFRQLSTEVRQRQVRQSMVGQWLMMAVRTLSSVGPALLYGYGGYLIIQHQLQLGTVVAFATYLVQLYGPASGLAGANTTLMGGLALFDRVFRFLDLPVEVPAPEHPQPWPGGPNTPAAVRFQEVTFAYQPPHAVLQGVSFTAEAGQLTAIVGPSGAGKSTMLALGARFYDPDAGSVSVGGRQIRDLDDRDLRRIMGVVTQDLFLFHTTLAANVRYGRPDASEFDVRRAVAAAQLDELVARLPEGLDTLVGERGYRLSGGEKQRVAIARAIVQNPRILWLDEATSSLDSHAERLIQEALQHLFAGRTVVAIAHRLSTVLAADQILVVSEGRIVERGRHYDLLAAGGLYARLYHEQFDPGLAAAAPAEEVVPAG